MINKLFLVSKRFADKNQLFESFYFHAIALRLFLLLKENVDAVLLSMQIQLSDFQNI